MAQQDYLNLKKRKKKRHELQKKQKPPNQTYFSSPMEVEYFPSSLKSAMTLKVETWVYRSYNSFFL